jgi:hypothetical protein
MQLARRKELRLAHVRYPFQMLRQVALRKKGRVSTSKGEMRKREMQKMGRTTTKTSSSGREDRIFVRFEMRVKCDA